MRIHATEVQVVNEPLVQPFGFKGGALTELWQVTCKLTSDLGHIQCGQGVQSVLWSDASIFNCRGQDEGNRLMLALTQRALDMLHGEQVTAPPDMIKDIIPELWNYGKQITGNSQLRETYILNALTPVDWALWRLYAQAQGCDSFEKLVSPFVNDFSIHQTRMGNIPLITYHTSQDEIETLAEQGRFLFKIKIGSNPGGRNNPEEMLQWDMNRLSQIHQILSAYDTPWTECGYPVYYLDANGRYDSMERLLRLMDYADRIGALERIVLLEEPFPEQHQNSVAQLPVVVAADESAHSAADAVTLMDDYGFGAITLKPIAKTLSVSLEVLKEAQTRKIPCFCADLTVNPTMVELNKLVAAHLPVLPGLRIGVFESNGSQNYRNWDQMNRANPAQGRPWAEEKNGIYHLCDSYFETDGGIWMR